ncbi:MAG TPA: hypothetical protein VGS57_10855 [Thermoanaerobaculia bacterium]|jgi:hypothetical protein|nr:hypothetical protein [Thermoanaerobaculia bacterium]
MKRIAIAAVVGGLAMFIWGAISHMLTPLGEAGLKSMPAASEPAVTGALSANVPDDGMYMFPGMDERARSTKEGQEEWMRRYAAGPAGLLIYHPHGGSVMNPKLFGIELLTNILAVAVAAWAASHVRTFARRVALVTTFGLAAWLSIEASYWNWYGFPTNYALAQLVDQLGGFFFAGLVVAWLVRPAPAAA